MWFDPHWHARDEEQAAAETIEHSLKIADAAGGTAIVAMPNTTRPLITLGRCRELSRAIMLPILQRKNKKSCLHQALPLV